MKSFFWKFVICLTPCILAGLVTGAAVNNYLAGEQGRFNLKLGVDLVGGTILVYEIDFKKKAEGASPQDKSSPMSDTNLLAESLKRRIDPNDLYNIVIRPAGGEGRVEIILPTGGVYRTQKAEEAWKKLLDEMGQKYGISTLDVPRGKTQELADRIHAIKAEKIWERVFQDPKAWNRLLEQAYKEEWPELPLGTDEKMKSTLKTPGDIPALLDFLQRNLSNLGTSVSESSLNAWVKRQAWRELLNRAQEKWPFLQPFKEELERIPPDNNEQLITFIQCRGNVFGQAVFAAVEPMIGQDALSGKDITPYSEIKDFIATNYGPSLREILETINTENEKTGRSRDLTVEEVQRIKELVAKVGALEFRMLANNQDDEAAIKDAQAWINNAENKDELERNQKEGLPPPGPRVPNTKRLKEYQIQLPRDNSSILTYSWVELGPQERKQLNLDNAAETDLTRNSVWQEAFLQRGKATTLKDPTAPGQFLLQGALFYSRESLNRNLPDEERRNKKVEYFVLARNPEIINGIQTPKIDGSFLVSAISAPGADMRPSVHFQFNNAGGELFGNLTRKNIPTDRGDKSVKRHLAIILDGLVMSAPTINSEIRTHGQITGSFSPKEVDALVNILRSGALPATLKPQPVSENTMGPTLGQDTIRGGVQAIFWSFLAVLAFMIVYYRFAGFVASVALLANLLLTVGFMIFVQATFTLPGLAGLVLMLGMAVDANVLIYERLREEREKGASLLLALRNGYDRALPTIIDTHLSGIFTAIVLYIVGNDQLKGFGVSLTAGLIISLFTSLYMTRVLFDFWNARGWLRKLSMFRFFSNPDIDFMAIRKPMFVATVAVALLGVGLFIGRLPNDLGIDFVGGTAYGGQLVKPATLVDIRTLLDDKHQEKYLKVEASEINPNRYQLTYQNPDGTTEVRTVTLANAPEANSAQERAKHVAKLASKLPDVSVELIYPSFQDLADPTTSHYFNVRTSEKEPEIVQASIDRLLRDYEAGKSASLLRRAYMYMDPITNKGTRFRFFENPPPADYDPDKERELPAENRQVIAYGSPSFVKTLLNRELARFFPKDQIPAYDLIGEGQTKEGGYSILHFLLKSEVASQLTSKQQEDIKTALENTQREFLARPQPDRLENFDSQLATETRFRAMWAIMASWGAILLYLWFRFGNWTFGLAAVICLIHDLFITLGAIAVCHYLAGTWLGDMLGLEDFKVDLTGVAALLTLVGYSVNDTIVVFDRIREVRGKNPDLTPKMINDSINQTLSRTLIASLTTWLVVFVLYVAGGPGVHLFAFTMVIGVLIGTYSSIYIASPLLLIFGEGHKEESRAAQGRPQPAGASA